VLPRCAIAETGSKGLQHKHLTRKRLRRAEGRLVAHDDDFAFGDTDAVGDHLALDHEEKKDVGAGFVEEALQVALALGDDDVGPVVELPECW